MENLSNMWESAIAAREEQPETWALPKPRAMRNPERVSHANKRPQILLWGLTRMFYFARTGRARLMRLIDLLVELSSS